MSAPKPKTKPKRYDDIEESASNADELLSMLVRYPGIDPYRAVSGMVRGVAVDRWLNEMIQRGFIVAWESDDNKDAWCDVTEAGKKRVKALEGL